MSESGESSSAPLTPLHIFPNVVRPYRFNWDPASRRPGGPESVSGTTEGNGDYFASQGADFQFNNASSLGLGLGTLPSEWSSSTQGFYAISTVLNNPHRSQAPPKAHSGLPAAPPADLPRVKRKDFDTYLRAIKPEWERFDRGSQTAEAGPSTPRAGSIGSINSIIQDGTIPTRSLDTVPSIFFQTDFDLSNLETFATVTEDLTLLGGANDLGSEESQGQSLPLLDRFSHYADTIEMHLTHEISVRSSSFFAALSNLHLLQSESAECLGQITRLRGMLGEVDDNVAKRGLEIVELEEKLRNAKAVETGVSGIKEMVSLTALSRELVSAGQWGEALNMVEDLEGMWNQAEPEVVAPRANGRHTPLPPTSEDAANERKTSYSLTVPLSAVRAFSDLPDHLLALTTEITSSLSNSMVHALRKDLEERAELQSGPEPNQPTLKEVLTPYLQGLQRTGGLKDAVLSWRGIALDYVQSHIGTHFPAFSLNEENTSDIRPGLAGHLRNLSHAEFVPAIQPVYKGLLNILHCLQSQNSAFEELLETISFSTTKTSLADSRTSIFAELFDLLASAAELSHSQAAQLVSARSDQHSSLPLRDFVEIFNESWDFVVKGEMVCGKMIVGLRGVIIGQAKHFLQTFHQSRLTQSAKLVEDEQWSPAEVTAAQQHLVDMMVDSAMQDSPELLFKAGPQTNGSSSPAVQKSSTQKHLTIEDRTYFTVPATNEVLSLLLDYIRIIVNLGTLTTDTMSRIIEFLKAFNSRTCQVVLGAGAMRSAGLKNITAKHLALASQSLSIMVSLIPYIRETFRRHLSPKQAVILVEFDKLKRDYQEHQHEIHAKLIAIMGDRLAAHIASLKAVDWNNPSAKVNGYMELLVKETITLHKVLSRYLSAAVVEDVMAQVFAAINHGLSEEYMNIDLPSAAAKESLLADARYLHQKLSALKNVGRPSGMLETVVKERPIPRPPGSPAQTPMRSSSLMSPTTSGQPSTATQRLKGLLSGRSSTLMVEKALPSPSLQGPSSPRSTSPIPVNGSPSASPRPSLSQTPSQMDVLSNGTSRTPSRPGSPLPPIPDRMSSPAP